MIANQVYAGVWTFKLGDESSVYYQKIRCIDLVAMSRISDMRMRVDKVMKDIDLYVGYRDSDLLFHLGEGLDMLNMLAIPTNWTYTQFSGFNAFPMFGLMECALLSLLRAQYLAEGDSSFDFSGQPVSLTIDRTGFIESEIGRLENSIETRVIPWKKQAVKRGSTVGRLDITYPTVSNTLGVNPHVNRTQGTSGYMIRRY
jgi:hypothetical protein